MTHKTSLLQGITMGPKQIKSYSETVSIKVQNPSTSRNHHTNEHDSKQTSSSKNTILFNGTVMVLNQTSMNYLY